jgi:hypothetical protein
MAAHTNISVKDQDLDMEPTRLEEAASQVSESFIYASNN